jgi:hypothetical protein
MLLFGVVIVFTLDKLMLPPVGYFEVWAWRYSLECLLTYGVLRVELATSFRLDNLAYFGGSLEHFSRETSRLSL